MSVQPVMAIDFGTTATCAATCAGPADSPQVVTHQGPKSSRLPSGVMWWEGQLLVGSAAYNRANLDPAAYEETPKRLLSQGDDYLLLGDHDVALVDALAAILTEAARPGLAHLKNEQAPWVLTHPAVWGPPQLELLRAAAAQARAASVTLLAEPVAAAWAVREDNLRAGAHVAVFDWGGGTFDAAVLKWDGSHFAQAGPAVGEDPLGGEDVDYALEQFVLRRLPEDICSQIEFPASRVDRRLGRELRRLTRLAKEELSESSHTELALSVLEEPVRITLDEFNVIAGPIVERCADVLQRCLTASGVQSNGLAAIYLVGDSSRIPLVYRLLKDRHPGVLVVPAELGKEATARGAALAAAAGAHTARAQPPMSAPGPAPEMSAAGTGRPSRIAAEAQQRSPAAAVPAGPLVRVLSAAGDCGADALSFSADGRLLACGIVDDSGRSANLVRLWNPETAELVRTLEITGHAGPRDASKVNSLSFGLGGRLAASAGGKGASIFDSNSGKIIRNIEDASHTAGVAFSPDGRFIAVSVAMHRYPETIIYNARNGHCLSHLDDAGGTSAIAFSPDSRLIALPRGAGDRKKTDISIAATPASELKQFFRDITDPGLNVITTLTAPAHRTVRSLAFSPDGQLLASADIEGKECLVRLWEIASGRIRRTLAVPGNVNGVAFSPDGRLLAAAGSDAKVRLWDLATGQLAPALNGHSGEVRAVAFSPDGRLLATAGDSVRLWNLPH